MRCVKLFSFLEKNTQQKSFWYCILVRGCAIFKSGIRLAKSGGGVGNIWFKLFGADRFDPITIWPPSYPRSPNVCSPCIISGRGLWVWRCCLIFRSLFTVISISPSDSASHCMSCKRRLAGENAVILEITPASTARRSLVMTDFQRSPQSMLIPHASAPTGRFIIDFK